VIVRACICKGNLGDWEVCPLQVQAHPSKCSLQNRPQFCSSLCLLRFASLPRTFGGPKLARFGGFLSLIAVTVPSLISNSPWQDGHFRRDETITVCIEVYTICSLQSGQVKGWSKKSSLTGRTDRNGGKQPFAYPSLRLELPPMPRGKINLQKVLASLNTPCPGCGHLITPAEINRVSWEEIKCPKCGLVFDPQKRR
jgi:predicted RNA-binding Zn-ribbon protein involved in translation (DUF1610 family)